MLFGDLCWMLNCLFVGYFSGSDSMKVELWFCLLDEVLMLLL